MIAPNPYRDDPEYATDEELARERRFLERRLALVDHEITAGRRAMTAAELAACVPSLRALLVERDAHLATPVAVLRDNARAFYRVQLEGLAREERRRRRAAERGVPRDTPARAVPDEVLAAIKRAIRLDGALLHEAEVQLGPPGRRQERRGRCPSCHTGADAFIVHLADPDDEWFYCQVCNQTGDVIDLVELVYRVSFREAVAILAPHCGVDWPPRPPSPPGPPERGRLVSKAGLDA